MVQKEVLDYITNGRSSGFSDSVLRSKLEEGGYDRSEIDEAFVQTDSGVKEIFPENRNGEINKQRISGKGVPWMKASGWIGGVLFFGLFLLGVLLLVYPSGIDSLLDDKVIFLALFIVGMSGMALFYSGFIKLGKSLNEGKLVLGSWLLIVSFFLVLVISLIGNSLNPESFEIIFTILSMSLIIVFIVGLVGQFLFSLGLVAIKKDVQLAGITGIMNFIMFVVFMVFAISFVVLSFSMINAVSDVSVRLSGFGINEIFLELGSNSGPVLFFSIMFGAYYVMKVVKLVFDVLVLRNGSRRFES